MIENGEIERDQEYKKGKSNQRAYQTNKIIHDTLVNEFQVLTTEEREDLIKRCEKFNDWRFDEHQRSKNKDPSIGEIKFYRPTGPERHMPRLQTFKVIRDLELLEADDPNAKLP